MSPRIEQELSGRAALVTGASRRLGRAIALRLARCGMHIGIHHRSDENGARTVADEITQMGGNAHLLCADLSQAGAASALVAEAWDVLGGFFALVNNAARFERTPIETLTTQHFDEQMATNARAVMEASQAAGLRMRAAGGGAIVNILDTSAERPWGTHIAYCASKGAALNLTRSFAQALAPSVRVNGVSPGAALPVTDAKQGSGDPPGGLIGGHSGSEPIAAATELLIRHTWMTGVVINIDGGRAIS